MTLNFIYLGAKKNLDNNVVVKEFAQYVPGIPDFAKKQAKKGQAYYKTKYDEIFWFKNAVDSDGIDLSPLELINTNYNFHRDRLNFKDRLLNDERITVNLLAQIANNNPTFKNNLWSHIMKSKKKPEISMIAANAMTILNVANESFSGLDLSGINVSTFIDNKWQGPNISGGTFGGTDFSGANLRGSMLFDSFFR